MILRCFGWVLLSLALSESDIAGLWSGSFDVVGLNGRAADQTLYLNPLQRGAEVTGTAGPQQKQQWPVENGKIDGDKITFEVRPPEGAAVRFDLRVVDDRLQGEASTRREGRLFRARVRVMREIV